MHWINPIQQKHTPAQFSRPAGKSGKSCGEAAKPTEISVKESNMTNTVKGLFEEEIRDLYDAEKQLVKALPKMAKAAESEELRSGFQEHLEATKGHVNRLEQVFESIGAKPKGKTCEAMKGLVAEGQEAIDSDQESELHDVLLIGAAKRVEHYEMAAYQTVIKLAEAMGNTTAAELLRETLSEEEETDQKLDEMCDQLLEGMGTAAGDDEAEEPEEATRPMAGKQTTSSTGAKTRRAG
jgi:ferritin-like metal-binding protein YciE